MHQHPEDFEHDDDAPHTFPEPSSPEDDLIVIEVEQEFGIEHAAKVTPLPPDVVALVRRQRMLTVAHLMDLPAIQWFIEGMLPSGPVTVMHGKGGTRKSFIMLDWVLCADQSLTWHGHWVKPGKTLYMAGEGVQGLGKRIRAWCAAHGVEWNQLTTDFMAIPLNLYSLKPEQVAKWTALVYALGYDYLVVDTLHTASSGADENSSQDIGLVYDNARRIAGEAQLFFLHHDPKQGKTARGSSAIRDDADVVIEIDRDSSLNLTSIIKPDKIRDADDFMAVHAHFEVWGEGLSSSLYIKAIGQDADPGALSGKGQRILNILGDHPGRTKNEVCNLLGSNNGVSDSFKALEAAGEIWMKEGPHQEGDKVRKRELWYTKDYTEEDSDGND
jgi:hypothetical protein